MLIIESIVNYLTRPGNNNKENHEPFFHQFVIDSLPVGVFTVDSDLRITDFNPRAEEITGYLKREALGRPCNEILQSELCRINCPLKTVINCQNPVVGKETVIYTKECDQNKTMLSV